METGLVANESLACPDWGAVSAIIPINGWLEHTMLEKHHLRIENKVVRISDIRRLATLVDAISVDYMDSKYTDVPEDKRPYSIRFSVQTSDHAEYQSVSLDIFKQEGILDTKRAVKLTMTFRDYEAHAEISIDLADSEIFGYDSSLNVEGSDTTWVNGAFQRLLDCVNSWENQWTSIKKYRWLIALPLTYLAGWTVVAIVIHLINIFSHRPVASVFSPYLLWLVGIGGFSWLIAEYLENLWPSIEIVPIPEHEQKLRKKRKRIWFLLSAIVFPFAIALAAGLLVK